MVTPLILSKPLRAELNRLGTEFLADFFSGVVASHPGNLEALSELAQAYTILGRHEEGLTIDTELVRALPESSTVRYNLACSLCLVGRSIDALDTLELAVSLGYDDAQHLEQDQDLAPLHQERRFLRILEQLNQPD